MSLFENLAPSLARALSKRGYESLTAVQKAVTAPDLAHADLVVSAQTGSGKTVAFGLNMAETLLGGAEHLPRAEAPLALIIAPTRELALQVKRELEWLYELAGARIASCVGGMDPRDERRVLNEGAHIVVGTPGRLVDHIRRGALEMDSLRVVVLDEADEMLTLGFREELETILEASPVERRTLMFSATMPRAIETLAKKYQRDAVRVNTVSEQKQHGDIEYRALIAHGHESENAIYNLLRYYDATNALVFCNTRMAVNRLTSRFIERGLSVVALSGELSQSERNHALQALRDRRAQVCVATDVAARGIDLPDLELVIHAELPKNTESLLHRSGRTGRAGRKGVSVLIVPYSARRKTERLLWDAKIEANWGSPPSAEEVRARDDARLLSDPIFAETLSVSEQPLAEALLQQYGADAIAAAFVRLYRRGLAAPDELSGDNDPSERRERPDRRERTERFERADRGERPARADRPKREGPRDIHRDPSFDPAADASGVWISLSVGRSKSAEPRWIIPMLCKAGGITKADIGTIRIQQNETHIKIYSANADSFFENIGDGKLEKSIFVTKLDDGPPSAAIPDNTPTRSSPSDFVARRKERLDKGSTEKPKYDRHREDRAPIAQPARERQRPAPAAAQPAPPERAFRDKPSRERTARDTGFEARPARAQQTARDSFQKKPAAPRAEAPMRARDDSWKADPRKPDPRKAAKGKAKGSGKPRTYKGKTTTPPKPPRKKREWTPDR